jgi:hypothetical protein
MTRRVLSCAHRDRSPSPYMGPADGGAGQPLGRKRDHPLALAYLAQAEAGCIGSH